MGGGRGDGEREKERQADRLRKRRMAVREKVGIHDTVSLWKYQ